MHIPKDQLTQIRRTVEYAKTQGWLTLPAPIPAPEVLPNHIQDCRDRMIKAQKAERYWSVRLKPTGRRLSLGTDDMEKAVVRGAQLMAICELHGEEKAVQYQQQEFRKINQHG